MKQSILSREEELVLEGWKKLPSEQRSQLLPHIVASMPEWKAVEAEHKASAITEWLMVLFIRAGLPFFNFGRNGNGNSGNGMLAHRHR